MKLKRYDISCCEGARRYDWSDVLLPSDDGDWCDYEQVAAILAAKDAEIAELTDENRALKSEVERLEAEARRLEGR
jgi:hypothetical protein